MTAYFDLLVRGVGLASQAGTIGGVFFIVLVLRPAATAELGPILFRSRSLAMASAVGLIVAQCLALAIMLESLANEVAGRLGNSSARRTSPRVSSASPHASGSSWAAG